jgi:O-antigen/teichoic acid export membrane protein
VIGVEMFGVLAIAAAIILYFQTFVDFGFDFTAARDIAKNQNNIEAVSKIFWTTSAAKLLLMLISILILLLLMCFIPYFKEHFLLISITFLYIPGRILFPEWFFQGMEKMIYITVLNVLAKLLFTILIFIVIKERSDYLYQPLLIAAGYLTAGLVSVYVVIKRFGIKFYHPSFQDIKKSIGDSFDVFINLLMPNLYNNLSTLLLGFWWGNSAAGIFDAGKKVILLSEQAILVLSRAFFPYLANNIRKHYIYNRLSLTASIVFMIVFFLGADFFVKILFTAEFEASKNIIRLMAISPVLFSLMNSYGTNYLILVHKEKVLRNITIISSLVGIVAAICLIHNFKAVGAAITLVFVWGLRSILCFVFSQKAKLELVSND